MKPTTFLRCSVAAATLLAAASVHDVKIPAHANDISENHASTLSGLNGLDKFIDGVMAQQITSHEVAGAVVTIVHNNRTFLTKGYGFADVDDRVAVDPQNTLFRPGSVSKLFTWVALMQQIEAGRVALDADVNSYIDFSIPPFEGQPVLVRHLMSHSPGMSDVSGISVSTIDELTSYGDWIKSHIPKRLWASGTEISYSNYGVALAGYIVEKVSDEPFADYVENHVFLPLGMTSTTFREPLPKALAPRMAKGYELEAGKMVAQPFELFSSIMPAGSGTSSASDMSRFIRALLNGGNLGSTRILKPGSVALLANSSIANTPGLPGMAHGFYEVRSSGPRLIGHGGNTGDFHSNLILAPEHDLGFFVSFTGGNKSSVGRTDLTNAIIGRLFPQTPSTRVAAPEGGTPPSGSFRANRRDYSQEPKPEYDIQITVNGSNGISLTRFGQTTFWERIGPMTYEQVTGTRTGGPFDRIKFYDRNGTVMMSYASQPYLAYRQIASQE